MDQGLIHLCTRIREDINLDVSEIPGAGAAGGMGAGMAAFLGSKLNMGIEVVLDMVHFNDIARGAKLILTGEGRLDGESLCGKVVDGVAGRAGPWGYRRRLLSEVSEKELTESMKKGFRPSFPSIKDLRIFRRAVSIRKKTSRLRWKISFALSGL